MSSRFVVLSLFALVGCANNDVHHTTDGGPTDAGRDARVADGGHDGGSIDGAVADAVNEDAPTFDATSIDAPALDAPSMDAAVIMDGGSDDTGLDAGGGDAGPPVDAGTDAGARDAGPPAAGSYLYRRIPVGGMQESTVVAFHPDGTYALVLERSTAVHVYTWATDTAVRIDLRVAGHALYLQDVVFDPAGAHAWIVGYEHVGTVDTGVIIEVDDASVRTGASIAAFTRLAATRTGEQFTGIEIPTAGDGPVGDGRPVVLSSSGPTPGYIARLRDLDPATGNFGSFIQTRPTSAGCDDLAFADDEFGSWGIVLACGTNGADAPYYTEIAGVGEWRPGPAATLGNASRAASHGTGDYALVVSWSGRDLDRYQAGAWRPSGSAPGWAALGIWDVSFSPDGVRALIVGRASASPLRGLVLEYRHDLYSTAAITDVSIPGFDAAPFIADSNTNLNDSAFKPGCDSGLIVGGETSFSGSTGLLIEFTREGGVSCRP